LRRRETHLDFYCRSRFVLTYSVAGNRLSNRPPPPPPPGPCTPDPRDEILDRVFRGELTPDEAESEAARRGLRPLAQTPGPAEFNPLSEPWWTLGMTAAWIIWRTPTAVRRVWSDYRRKVIEWHGPFYYRRHEGGYGYEQPVDLGDDGKPSEKSVPVGEIVRRYGLVKQSPLSLSDVLARAASGFPEDGKAIVEGPAAKNELWRQLQLGELVAEGISTDTSERRTIRDAEWVDLDYLDQPGWLSDAIGVSLEKRERYRSVRVRREDVTRIWIDPRLRDIIKPPKPELPPTQSPTDGGYMPLYCAAQWIASKGGVEVFNPLDLPRWKTAYGELLARLASEDVRVVGNANGVPELVPGFNFAACPIDYPFQDIDVDLYFSGQLYLRSYPYFGNEDWIKGKDDSLRIRRKPRWTGLMVEKDAVARYWPFTLMEGDNLAEITKTGAAGRPSVMHILHNELAERCKAAKIETSLAAQVRVLREWFKVQYPRLPCPAQKTTENGLRAQYRAAKGPRN
jgi:hypothetical protein